MAHFASGFMRSLHPWPIFPANLDPPVARSLSIQFILQEMIKSFELLEHLRKSTPQPIEERLPRRKEILRSGVGRQVPCRNWRDSSLDPALPPLQGATLGWDCAERPLQNRQIKAQIHVLSKELEKLLLFSLENPFAQKGSVIDKLCFYSEILLQASNISSSEVPLTLEEMRNAVLRMKSKIIGWKKNRELKADQVFPLFHGLYNELHQKLMQFFAALFIYLKEARSDENILTVLIENRKKLNLLLGPRTIENLFCRLFPSGPDQLRAVICEGYTRRGFISFLSQVETLIDDLEWEASCHSALTT